MTASIPDDHLPALESPTAPLLDSEPLSSIAASAESATIVVTDSTRPVPEQNLLRLILDTLIRSGVRADATCIVIGTGLHAPMSPEAIRHRFGESISSRFTIVNHSAVDDDGLLHITDIDGVPVEVNRACVESDLLISTGVVEPHQYAGFSGGSKGVVIGCGGEATIEATHGIEMLSRTETKIASFENNPFQQFVRAAGRAIGLDYIVNVVLDRWENLHAAACGSPDSVHDYLSRKAFDITARYVDEPIDILSVSVPASKGRNLYQASRAVTYQALVERSALRSGAPIILEASLEDGCGEGIGEQRFCTLMTSGRSPRELVAHIEEKGLAAGAQRAYMLARAMNDHTIIVVGAHDPRLVEQCGMVYVDTPREALTIAEEIVAAHGVAGKDPNVKRLDNGISELAILNDSSSE